MLSPTTRLPGVTLTLPAEFHLLPLDADLQARVAAQTALLDELPMADGPRRELVALYLESMATRLRGADIAAAAFCAVRIGDHASTATVTVGFHETNTTDRTLALLGTVATLRGRDDDSDVETTAYAGQPAVRWTSRHDLSTGEGSDPIRLHEAQVLVQAPDVPVAVLITVATPTTEDKEIYRDVLHRACESLEFAPPTDPGTPAASVLLLPSVTL